MIKALEMAISSIQTEYMVLVQNDVNICNNIVAVRTEKEATTKGDYLGPPCSLNHTVLELELVYCMSFFHLLIRPLYGLDL